LQTRARSIDQTRKGAGKKKAGMFRTRGINHTWGSKGGAEKEREVFEALDPVSLAKVV